MATSTEPLEQYYRKGKDENDNDDEHILAIHKMHNDNDIDIGNARCSPPRQGT